MGRASSYATEKRAKILEYLKDHQDEAVSVKDIEMYLQSRQVAINVTTIYRYLGKLEQEGQVLRHTAENGNTASFQYINPEHACHSHLHMKCSGCGKIFHMDCAFMDEFQRHIYEHHHFTLECKTSMLYGLCESCRSGREMK